MVGHAAPCPNLFQSQLITYTELGNVRSNLYAYEDTGVDTRGVCNAVGKVLGLCNTEQEKKLRYPINAREWRAWSNPEFLLRRFGLRLEDLSEELSISILGVLKTSFSPEGYQKALDAMRINHFLGEVCEVFGIMNQYSYNFLLFGEPSEEKVWGWVLYGHHLCLSVFFRGRHIVVSPTFTVSSSNLVVYAIALCSWLLPQCNADTHRGPNRTSSMTAHGPVQQSCIRKEVSA